MLDTQQKGRILNKHFRNMRPVSQEKDVYKIRVDNAASMAELIIYGTGCVVDKSGGCMMCDFGVRDSMPTKEQCRDAVLQVYNYTRATAIANRMVKKGPYKLFFSCNGSLLNNHDFPAENLEIMLKTLSQLDLSLYEIIIGTHLESISGSKLDHIKSILPNTKITFQLGFETSNAELRYNGLLKNLDNSVFAQTVKTINSYGMNVNVNLICGCPFLTPQEQIDDVVSSVDFCVSNGVQSISLFPMVDRNYTLLHELYKSKIIIQPNIFLLCDALKSMPTKYLNNIYIAGVSPNAIDTQNDLDVYPQYLDDVALFLDKYNSGNGMADKTLMVGLLTAKVASMPEYTAYKKQNIKALPGSTIHERVDNVYNKIAQKYNIDLLDTARAEAGIITIK